MTHGELLFVASPIVFYTGTPRLQLTLGVAVGSWNTELRYLWGPAALQCYMTHVLYGDRIICQAQVSLWSEPLWLLESIPVRAELLSVESNTTTLLWHFHWVHFLQWIAQALFCSQPWFEQRVPSVCAAYKNQYDTHSSLIELCIVLWVINLKLSHFSFKWLTIRLIISFLLHQDIILYPCVHVQAFPLRTCRYACERAQMYMHACTWTAAGPLDVVDAWRVLGQQIVRGWLIQPGSTLRLLQCSVRTDPAGR